MSIVYPVEEEANQVQFGLHHATQNNHHFV